jgi:DNA-binding NtrC family response regulator
MFAQAAIETPPLIDIRPAAAPATAPGQPAALGTLGLLDARGDVRPLDELEGEVIRFAIAHYRGQMSEIARRLQIGRSTLYRKLEQFGLAERSGAEHEPARAR